MPMQQIEAIVQLFLQEEREVKETKYNLWMMSSSSSFFQDFQYYIEEQCDEARNNQLETKEILRFFLRGENEMIVILDWKVEKYDISERGKMVDNYHMKHGMNKLRGKFGKNLLNQPILIRRKIKRWNITKLLKILKKKLIILTMLMTWNIILNHFHHHMGKCSKRTLLNLPKEVLNQLGDWLIIWTKHTIIMQP